MLLRFILELMAGKDESKKALEPSRATAGAADASDEESVLGDLPDGSLVAFVTMLGSLCPVTRAHLQMFEEAQKLLLLEPRPDLGLGPYDACLGRISLNPDRYVGQKLDERNEMAPLSQDQRRELVNLAISDAGMQWVKHGDADDLKRLKRQWPRLRFDWAVLNGADDVVKYKKWRMHEGEGSIMITMGRPGSMEELKQGLLADGVQESASFVLGPDLPDISSTAARAAALGRNREELVRHVHPTVADWLLTTTTLEKLTFEADQRCIRCDFLREELSGIKTTAMHERKLKHHFKQQGWSEEKMVEKLAATIDKISCQSEAAAGSQRALELGSRGSELLIQDYVLAVRTLADSLSLPALDVPYLPRPSSLAGGAARPPEPGAQGSHNPRATPRYNPRLPTINWAGSERLPRPCGGSGGQWRRRQV